ncbi:MAG: hypothetical protein IPP52_15805 [Ignavibacteria bacterium]|nr:hypothetical protein [Ignavibacteria bacterium]
MKTLIILISILTAGIIFSQDLKINNNPYEKADAITRSRKAFQRENGFMNRECIRIILFLKMLMK